MPRASRPSRSSLAQTELLDVGKTTAPAVPEVRLRVAAWRDAGYPGVTDATRACLAWWFPKDGHRRPGGRTFRYHPF
ncbi:MAG: hypothetical protein M3154_11750 [Candidatus Eremiobacteraeota bacterium]|nr:hypothetical protein [Candidatus Eremiobacteraeota bacterium]